MVSLDEVIAAETEFWAQFATHERVRPVKKGDLPDYMNTAVYIEPDNNKGVFLFGPKPSPMIIGFPILDSLHRLFSYNPQQYTEAMRRIIDDNLLALATGFNAVFFEVAPGYARYGNIMRKNTGNILVLNPADLLTSSELIYFAPAFRQLPQDEYCNIVSFGSIVIPKGEVIVYTGEPGHDFSTGDVLNYHDVQVILEDPGNDWCYYCGKIREDNIERLSNQDVVFLRLGQDEYRAEPEQHTAILNAGIPSGSRIAFVVRPVDRTGAGPMPEHIPFAVLNDDQVMSLLGISFLR